MLRKPLFVALAMVLPASAHATLIRSPISLTIEATAVTGSAQQITTFTANSAQILGAQSLNPGNTGAFAFSPSGRTAAAAFMTTGITNTFAADFDGRPDVSFSANATTETMARKAAIDYRIQYNFTKTDAGFHDVFYKLPFLDVDAEHLHLLNPSAGEELLASFNVGIKVDGSTVWSTGVEGVLTDGGLSLTQTGTQYNVTSSYQNASGFRIGSFGISEANLEIDLGVWAENETRLVEFFYTSSMFSDAHSEITGSGSPSGQIGGNGFRAFEYRLAEASDPNDDDDGGDGGTRGGGEIPVPAPGTLALCMLPLLLLRRFRASAI